MRLIDAEALKDIFCENCATIKRYGRSLAECRDYTDSYGNRCFKMRHIDAAPAIDYAPVKHGEWVEGLKCSKCGQVDMTKPNFCPNCGAKNGRRVEE